jgi:hypothetical protein
VVPSLATRYPVEVFANGTSTTPLASSTVSTVFVSNEMHGIVSAPGAQ